MGGDKAYDTAEAECRNLKVTPHVAQNLEQPVEAPLIIGNPCS